MIYFKKSTRTTHGVDCEIEIDGGLRNFSVELSELEGPVRGLNFIDMSDSEAKDIYYRDDFMPLFGLIWRFIDGEDLQFPIEVFEREY
jgi:hypothetical protein